MISVLYVILDLGSIMRAAIFNPYLDTLGGGERYTMAVAATLVKLSYKVDVEWADPSIKHKLEQRFGIKLDGVNFVKDTKRGDGYDVMFWVSDGSIPTLRARKNLLHFQVPFKNVGGKSLINKFKLARINKIVCNSSFTKNVIDKEFGVNSAILYPPVDVDSFKAKRKENIILNVARFSSLMQSKRQDVLVKTFKNFSLTNKDYKLYLAGGVEVGAEGFIEELKKQVDTKFIKIIESPGFKELKDLYGRAKIFWSASGYEIDEEKEPKKVEHFGITLVEAMAAGAVPIVFQGGGHKEIVTHGEDGFLWKDTGELYRYTKEIIEDNDLRKMLVENAKKCSQKFSYDQFEKNLASLL